MVVFCIINHTIQVKGGRRTGENILEFSAGEDHGEKVKAKGEYRLPGLSSMRIALTYKLRKD